MSSIARAFTLRRRRNDSESNVEAPPSPPRSTSVRHQKKAVNPREISGPMQLLSTTNMLTYNAPDVAVVQAQRKASSSVSSGSSSRRSLDDSDASSTSSRSRDTQLTDASSVGSNSPVSSPSTDSKPAFFEAPPKSVLRRSVSTFEIRNKTLAEEHANDPPRSESPAIPQRHPSHSKRAHAELARKRSMQGGALNRANSSGSHSRHASVDFFNGRATDSISSTPSSTPSLATPPPPSSTPHPFGKELEQLEEVAEEFTGAIHDVERANDLRVMRQRGLARFCAAEYMAEIESLLSAPTSMGNTLAVPAMAWI